MKRPATISMKAAIACPHREILLDAAGEIATTTA
jgi:hypothetical protein